MSSVISRDWSVISSTIHQFGVIISTSKYLSRKNCSPASGKWICLTLRAWVKINVWPNNDLIIFSGLLTLEGEQETPRDGESTAVVWGSQGTDTWWVYSDGRVRKDAEYAWWKLRGECWFCWSGGTESGSFSILATQQTHVWRNLFLHSPNVNVLFHITWNL